MSRSEKLIFKGTPKQQQYVGSDKDGKDEYTISCRQGDEIWITPAKKAELLKDHGEWFVEPNKVTARAEQPKPEPEPETVSPKRIEAEKAPEDYMRPQPVPRELEKAIIASETFDYDSMTNAELRELAGTDNKRLSKKKLIKMITDKKKE